MRYFVLTGSDNEKINFPISFPNEVFYIGLISEGTVATVGLNYTGVSSARALAHNLSIVTSTYGVGF